MKILRLTAENIKKIKVVDISPDCSVVQITGANGSGKSSVLDAIYYALNGTKDIPSQPVRRGEQKATIRLELGEITVIRRFTESGGTSLVVEAESGARFPSPQKLLDDLLGALTFDPLEFSRMLPKQQLEQLRRLVKLDIDIDALDEANDLDFAKRTDANRRVKALTEREATLRSGVDPAADVTLIDSSALLAEMEQAGRHNAAIERDRAERQHREKQAEADAARFTDLQQRAELLRQQAEALEAEAKTLFLRASAEFDALAALSPLADPIDTFALRKQIEDAGRTNRQREQQARQREMHRQAVDEYQAAVTEALALTHAIEDRTRQKAAAIAAAHMPIDGLSFGNGAVLYNGLPFDQASSAEQLRVSVAIAMAGNPKLRVLRIKDGSLLDNASLAMIAQMADEGDYQIWVERVQEGGRVGIEMQDGAVAVIDGTPVQHEETVAVG